MGAGNKGGETGRDELIVPQGLTCQQNDELLKFP